MTPLIPRTSTSPTLYSSTTLYFLTSFCLLLLIFLLIIAFSIIISLTIISVVHVITATLRRQGGSGSGSNNDVESDSGDRDNPQLGHDIVRISIDHRSVDEAATMQSSRQIIEMLDRVLWGLGEGRRRGEERLREAVERLPPRVWFGSQDCKAKECVICLEEFEDEDLCQVFPMCNHVFHWTCIGNWLKKNPSCPLCRTCILERACEK